MFKKNIFLTVSLISAIAVFAFVLLEVTETRNDMLKLVKNESLTLIESINANLEHTLAANDAVEDIIMNGLNSVAALAGKEAKYPSSQKLAQLAQEFDVSQITLIDEDGKLFSSTPTPIELIYELPDSFTRSIEPALNGDYEWIDLGLTNNPVEGEPMFMLARHLPDGGCVIVGLKNNKLLEFRRLFGLGKQIKKIAENPDIIYIVLQDTSGIYAATRNIDQMPPINSDTNLKRAFNKENPTMSIQEFEGGHVFEVCGSFKFDEDSRMLTRIGLSLDYVKKIQDRSAVRVIIIGIVLLVALMLAYFFVFTRKRLLKLNIEHQKIQNESDMVLSNVAEAVIGVDKRGEITHFNIASSEFFGIHPKKALGRQYISIFPTDSLGIMKIFSGSVPENVEMEMETWHGRKFFSISYSLIEDEAGNKSIFVFIKDVTAGRRAAAQTARKEKLMAMGELAGSVAHEIRNPLNAINMIAQRFELEFEPTDDSEEYYKLSATIRKESQRVNKIIHQFLDFAKPSKPSFVPVKLDAIIHETADIVAEQARSSGVALEINSETEKEIMLDSEKIKQALLNLFINSIEAMPEGGVLKCNASRDEDDVTIVIEDTGIGMPEEVQNKIFNLYYTTKPGGTGLGLSIVHQIISEHEGDISVRSQPGKGTKITIKLPLVQQEKK